MQVKLRDAVSLPASACWQQTMEMTQQTLFAQTLRLAFRIAIVWAGGFVFAVSVRAVLPEKLALTFTSPRSTLLPPLQPHRFLDLHARRAHRLRHGGGAHHARRSGHCARLANRSPPQPLYTLPMQSDPALEWRRLTEHYREMSDEELRELAADFANLTETAQQVLAQEMRSRGLGDPQAPGSLRNSQARRIAAVRVSAAARARCRKFRFHRHAS